MRTQTFRVFDGLAQRAQERAEQLGFSANDLLVAGLHSLLDDFYDPEEIELLVVEAYETYAPLEHTEGSAQVQLLH